MESRAYTLSFVDLNGNPKNWPLRSLRNHLLNKIRHIVITLEPRFSVTALDLYKNWPLKTLHTSTKFSVIVVVSRKTFFNVTMFAVLKNFYSLSLRNLYNPGICSQVVSSELGTEPKGPLTYHHPAPTTSRIHL